MEINSKPTVINLELMLQPISEEKPVGESLRYTGIYDEIQEARRADDNLNQGEWVTDLKVADFRKVIGLAAPALEQDTKDLQIAAWLSEALVKEYGFAGFRDGLKLLRGLEEKFWENIYPVETEDTAEGEIEIPDMEGRANAISWMDTQCAFALKGAAITGAAGYSYNDWEDSKRFDIPDNIETLDSADQQKYKELRTQAEKENRVTAAKWRVEIAQSRRAFFEELNFLLSECWTEYNELNRVNEEKYDRNQTPGLGNLKKALDDIQAQVKRLLEEKRLEEPDEADTAADEGETAVGEDGVVVKTAGVATASGAIQNRQDALKRLSDIASFFQKTEPHSPISYLVQRAVKWGNMPLESWLQDVIKDETVIFQIRQTLGFNTQSADSDASNP